jgi:homoserine O-succinyltransferase/O-acetyltransferase
MSIDGRSETTMPPLDAANGDAGALLIGLVNNMPAAAKKATEEQFMDLLATAADARGMRIKFFVAENDPGRAEETLHVLRQLQPDAVIVTGDEPRRQSMLDEPLWPGFARLVDWAADNTIAAVWSCMAAHAAVCRLDQIARRRMPQKLSGIYECEIASEHPLLDGFPPRWPVAHSRHNAIEALALKSAGYQILAHAPRVGADSFVKQVGGSLFLFLQGHLEYAPDSLFREYRRDIRRFLTGEAAVYPEMPENYFDQKTARQLAKLRIKAERSRSPRLLAEIYAVFAATNVPEVATPAAQLYGNWLSYLAQEKARRDSATPVAIEQQRGAA